MLRKSNSTRGVEEPRRPEFWDLLLKVGILKVGSSALLLWSQHSCVVLHLILLSKQIFSLSLMTSEFLRLNFEIRYLLSTRQRICEWLSKYSLIRHLSVRSKLNSCSINSNSQRVPDVRYWYHRNTSQSQKFPRQGPCGNWIVLENWCTTLNILKKLFCCLILT